MARVLNFARGLKRKSSNWGMPFYSLEVLYVRWFTSPSFLLSCWGNGNTAFLRAKLMFSQCEPLEISLVRTSSASGFHVLLDPVRCESKTCAWSILWPRCICSSCRCCCTWIVLCLCLACDVSKIFPRCMCATRRDTAVVWHVSVVQLRRSLR